MFLRASSRRTWATLRWLYDVNAFGMKANMRCMASTKNTTDTVVMVEPTHFAYNAQTAVNNLFQHKLALQSLEIKNKALDEFKTMVEKLKAHNINVIVLPSPAENTPDAVFPNNWFSTHLIDEDRYIFVYPMFCPNRSAEVQVDVLRKYLLQQTRKNYKVQDFRRESRNVALEGTGAFIFDYQSKTAFMSRSERANESLARNVADKLGYELICFTSFDKNNQPIYHTNVMMNIGESLAYVCLSSIKSNAERDVVANKLRQIGKVVIELSMDQVYQMAANVLEVKSTQHEHYLLLSKTADDALTDEQKKTIDQYCIRLPCAIPTIERIGGGSVRCMLAHVFY